MIDIDLNHLPTFQVYDYNYDAWFEKIHPHGQVMNAEQRRTLVQMIDSDVAINENFLNLIIGESALN